jgi:iron(III) transport system ATP-binding protein
MKAITLNTIRKTYTQNKDNPVVLDSIDLAVSPGEFFFLLGPSGCGKTTLLKIIAGLIEPDSGTVVLGDRDVTAVPIERRNCALVFQNYALWPHMTVQQNVEFGPKMQGKDKETRLKLAVKQLELVQMASYLHRKPNQLSGGQQQRVALHRKPNQLSGGQQQRVALARALAAAPDCLLLDEPLSNLDAKLRSQMRIELRKLIKASGATAVYVTHDQKEALAMADRIAVMHGGRIVQIATPTDMYNKPANRFVADFVGEANFVDGRVLQISPNIRVETPIGVLTSCRQTPVTVGQNVTCCVRPEKVNLEWTRATASSTSSRIPAKVAYVCNLGEICQYQMALPNGHSWLAVALAVSDMVEGDRQCHLGLRSEDVIILTH